MQGIFAHHGFLHGLGERNLMILASGARPFTHEANEMLGREGEPARAFYLIQAGHVALEVATPQHGLVTIETAGKGDIVGWSWLVPPHRWKFDCRALDRVQGLAFDAEWLREKCENDHELGYHLLKQLVTVLASRLAATRLRLLELYK
jgi:CRP-like cAMP-binding protein